MEHYADYLKSKPPRPEDFPLTAHYHTWTEESVTRVWKVWANNQYLRTQYYPREYFEAFLAQARPHLGTVGVVADIGCGTGTMLSILAQAGIGTAAHRRGPVRRVAREAADRVRGRFEADVQGRIDQPDSAARRLVRSRHLHGDAGTLVPERFHQGLAEIARVLKPGGHLLTTVPLEEKPAFVVCPECYSIFTPFQHMLFNFTIAGLAQELGRHGVEIVHVIHPIDTGVPRQAWRTVPQGPDSDEVSAGRGAAPVSRQRRDRVRRPQDRRARPTPGVSTSMSIQRAIEPMGEWGLRAARLYGEDYATRYSEADQAAAAVANDVFVRLSAWLAGLCAGFERPISVLDLGCGTGRYFPALSHVRELVGIDASESMLERARAASLIACARRNRHADPRRSRDLPLRARPVRSCLLGRRARRARAADRRSGEPCFYLAGARRSICVHCRPSRVVLGSAIVEAPGRPARDGARVRTGARPASLAMAGRRPLRGRIERDRCAEGRGVSSRIARPSG